jgi:hypothetical protein
LGVRRFQSRRVDDGNASVRFGCARQESRDLLAQFTIDDLGVPQGIECHLAVEGRAAAGSYVRLETATEAAVGIPEGQDRIAHRFSGPLPKHALEEATLEDSSARLQEDLRTIECVAYPHRLVLL